MNLSYSLYKIINQSKSVFSEFEYSRFKFGDTVFAEKFANELFNSFIEQYRDLILSKDEIILIPSPYYSIPTASNFLCTFFKNNLNMFLFENKRNACKEGKIHRVQTYVEDYGNMNYEERLCLISNDTYYLDKVFVMNKFCIFLDDIKITGSHERTVNRILKENNVNGEFMFIYFAELINKNIHPNIENHFNYSAINDLSDIVDIINSNSFRFNTRIVKYILLLKEEDFKRILASIPKQKHEELLDLAISNNYHQIEEYKNNIILLNQVKLWLLTCKKDNEKQLELQNLQLD